MIIRRRFRIGKVTSPTGSLPVMKGNSVRAVFRGSSGTPFPPKDPTPGVRRVPVKRSITGPRGKISPPSLSHPSSLPEAHTLSLPLPLSTSHDVGCGGYRKPMVTRTASPDPETIRERPNTRPFSLVAGLWRGWRLIPRTNGNPDSLTRPHTRRVIRAPSRRLRNH
jgi:hypothetical protein